MGSLKPEKWVVFVMVDRRPALVTDGLHVKYTDARNRAAEVHDETGQMVLVFPAGFVIGDSA